MARTERSALDSSERDAPGGELGRREGRRGAERTILVVIASAGALGALARYGFARLVSSPAGHFPWATFWTNVSGSLVIGLVLVLVTERFPRARLARPLVATGFLGAFTTFSTYTVGTDLLVRDHRVGLAALYALASLAAGAVAALGGIVAARLLVRLDRSLDEQLR